MKRIFLENRTVKELQSIAKALGYQDVIKMKTKQPLINILTGHTYKVLIKASRG